MSNSTSAADHISSLTVEIVSVLPFLVLIIPVLIMFIGRLAKLGQHDWRRLMPILVTMFLTTIYCLYQIPAGLLVGTGAYFGDSVLPLIIIRNMIPYIHNTLFIWLSGSYVWVLVRASVVFDVTVIAASITSREDRNKRKKILRVMRTLSGVVILLGAFIFFLTAIALCVMYGLRKYGYIPTVIYQYVSTPVNAVIGVSIILSLILILAIFTILLIIALKKANQVLIKSLGNKNMEQHLDKIKERKLIITRYGIGLVIYAILGLIMLVGIIWYLIRLTVSTYIENVCTDLTMRVIPSIIFIVAMLIVFWPFLLPKIMCTAAKVNMLTKVFNTPVNVDSDDDLVTTESTVSNMVDMGDTSTVGNMECVNNEVGSARSSASVVELV